MLSLFFAEMTHWEQYVEQAGVEDAEVMPRLLAIWEKYVSEKLPSGLPAPEPLLQLPGHLRGGRIP